jgi:hypothetical protein
MLRRVALLGLVALPLAARAAPPTPAAGTVTFSDPPATRVTTPTADAGYYVGTSQCNGSNALQISWLAQLSGTTAYPTSPVYAILASNNSAANCGSGTTGTVATQNATGRTQPSEETYTGTLGAFLTQAGLDCAGTTDKTVYVCVRLQNGTDATAVAWTSGSFVLQLAPAQAPDGDGVTVTPSDAALKVSWQKSATPPVVKDYQAIARQVSPACATGCEFRSPWTTDTSTTVGGLTNGNTYAVTVVARSYGNNTSTTESAPAQNGTPVPIDDGWDHYKAVGGREVGGCATSGGAGLAAGLAALALLAATRRRS